MTETKPISKTRKLNPRRRCTYQACWFDAEHPPEDSNCWTPRIQLLEQLEKLSTRRSQNLSILTPCHRHRYKETDYNAADQVEDTSTNIMTCRFALLWVHSKTTHAKRSGSIQPLSRNHREFFRFRGASATRRIGTRSSMPRIAPLTNSVGEQMSNHSGGCQAFEPNAPPDSGSSKRRVQLLQTQLTSADDLTDSGTD